MPIKEDFGVKMAKTLLAELTLPPGAKEQKSHSDILDFVPSDCKFFKHEKEKRTIEPTKEALLHDMLQDKKSTIAFCCASLQTDTRLTFDIDHVFPREHIAEKQKILLNYLNDTTNTVIAQAFMGETAPHDAHKTDIGKYFKRDPKDGKKIKGTKWFFDVCYNSLNNLTHLKHYLNRGKSSTTPREWFDNHFPQRFKDDVRTSGGINEGIIMQQIFPIDGLDSINIGKDSHGANVVVYLHETTGVGLGEFIRQWFKTNADTIIAESKEIQEINTKLTAMLTEDLRDDEGEEELKKFISTINEALRMAENRSKMGEETSEDSQEAGETRKKVSYKAILWAFEYMHSVKQIKKQILDVVAATDKDAVKKDFYALCAEQLLYLTPKGIEIAVNYFRQQCDNKKSSGTFFTADEVKALIVQSGKKGNPEERLDALVLDLFIGYLEGDATEKLLQKEYKKLDVTIPYEEWKQAGIARATAQLQSAASQQQPLSLLSTQQTSFTPAFDTNSQQLAQSEQFVVPPATLQSPDTPEAKKPRTTT